jgi:hypothetical protein
VSSRDDNDAEMADYLEQLGAAPEGEDPLVAADVAMLVREIHDLGRQPPPAPSAQLEVLLTQGLPNLRRRRARGRRRRVLVGAVVIGSMSMTGIAAAADHLPGRSRGVVTDVINNLTPFHVGVRDKTDRPAGPSRPSPSVVHQPPARPSHSRPSNPPTPSRERSTPSEPVSQPAAAPAPRTTERERENVGTPSATPRPTSSWTGEDDRTGPATLPGTGTHPSGTRSRSTGTASSRHHDD